MKISKKYLQQIIVEETNKILSEINEEEEFLQIFLELHDSLIHRQKTLGKKIKLVDNQPSFEEILYDLQKEKNLSPYDLYEKLKDFQDKIDSNMYEILSNELKNKFYEEDAIARKEPEKSQEEFDKEASEMYRQIYGKPDLTIVK